MRSFDLLALNFSPCRCERVDVLFCSHVLVRGGRREIRWCVYVARTLEAVTLSV